MTYNTDTPLVRLFKTEYSKEYSVMAKNGIVLTDQDVRLILGYPQKERKKLFGIF